MPKVYITQEVTRLNPAPALRYGDLVPVLSLDDRVPLNAAPTIRRMARGMRDIGPDDYVLPLGHPVAQALGIMIACELNNGVARVLIWEREERQYVPVTVDMNALDDALDRAT